MATKSNTLKSAMLKNLEKSLGVVTVAARKTKIDRATHYKWYHADPKYKQAVDELQDVALDFAEEKLHAQIKAKDTTATIFYLKTKGKSRGYVERTELIHKLGKDLADEDYV